MDKKVKAYEVNVLLEKLLIKFSHILYERLLIRTELALFLQILLDLRKYFYICKLSTSNLD